MEYTALYRRFRPMTFEEIIGQDHITRTLRNQVIANRVGHAYLFTGCRGCGKTSSAKVLARAINCLNPKNGEPCNECSICKAAIEGSLTDIVEMDAASNNSVDDIRNIRDEVNFLPTVAKYRVYIIDEVHMLSTGAFNALLKTLEEPPQHVKFILATTEPQKLPATILSRCQRFDFKKISPDNISIVLKKVCQESNIEYTENSINLIAELSEGAMRDALSILERCAQDGENKVDEEKIKELIGIPKLEYISKITSSIINYDSEEALKVTQSVIDEGKDISNFLWEIIKYNRDILMYQATKNISNVYSDSDKKEIEKFSNEIKKDRLLNIIYILSKLQNDIKWSSQKNIVFQVEILKLCSRQEMSIEERVDKLENTIKNGNIYMNFTENMNNKINDKSEMKTQNKIKESKIFQKQDNENFTNKLSTNSIQNVDNNEINNSKEKGDNSKKYVQAENASFWDKIIDNLKESRIPILYANLLNTKATIIDDMTVGIEFPNGLNSFEKSVIEKPENMAKLKEMISMECKKDMRVKLIDLKQKNVKQDNTNSMNIGIDINMIDD